MIVIRVTIFVSLVIVSGAAQSSLYHLRGNLETNRSPQNVVLELRPSGGALHSYTTEPGSNGQFDFPGVDLGQYMLLVKTLHGEVLKQEYLTVGAASGEITIRLDDRKPAEGRGTVSARQLAHRTPKAARKAMTAYRKCHDRRNDTCAARYLDKAIAADPELLEAYLNRSALRCRAQAWDLVFADVEEALRLDPNSSLAHINRAFAALHRKNSQLALVSARAALRSDPDNIKAQYLLGLAQVNLGDTQTGLRLLEKIAAEYKPARLALVEAKR